MYWSSPHFYLDTMSFIKPLNRVVQVTITVFQIQMVAGVLMGIVCGCTLSWVVVYVVAVNGLR